MVPTGAVASMLGWSAVAAVVLLVSPVCEWFSCATVCTTVLTIAALTLLK